MTEHEDRVKKAIIDKGYYLESTRDHMDLAWSLYYHRLLSSNCEKRPIHCHCDRRVSSFDENDHVLLLRENLEQY